MQIVKRDQIRSKRAIKFNSLTWQKVNIKVSKSLKQILKYSFEPKNEQKYFYISALADKMRSNQKSSVRESK